MSDREKGAILSPVDDRLGNQVLEAAANIDLEAFQRIARGDDISELSTNTGFEGLEISPDAIFTVAPERFEASGIIYITLNYGGSRDSVSMPDSYPAVVRGHFTENGAEIDEVEVDTGSFYQ